MRNSFCFKLNKTEQKALKFPNSTPPNVLMIISLQGMLRKEKFKSEKWGFRPVAIKKRNILDIYENEELRMKKRGKKKLKHFQQSTLNNKFQCFLCHLKAFEEIYEEKLKKTRKRKKKVFPFHFHYFIFILLLSCFCVCLGYICLESTIAVAKNAFHKKKKKRAWRVFCVFIVWNEVKCLWQRLLS